MKTTFSAHEHSRIGFPGVVLKWSVENGRFDKPRIVIKGIISTSYGWSWHNSYPEPFMNQELELFDVWVGRVFEMDASVQG